MSEASSAIAPPFRADDYARNLARVQDDLAARGLRAGVLFDPESIYWLTGYQSIGYFTFQGLVVPADGRPVLVSRRVNEGLARPRRPWAASWGSRTRRTRSASWPGPGRRVHRGG